MTAVQPVRLAGRLDPVGVSEVLKLAAETGSADGVHPLSEETLLRLRAGDGTPGTVVHLMSRLPDGGLVGYAQLDLSDAGEGPAAELFVHAAHRRHGVGRALLDIAVDTATATAAAATAATAADAAVDPRARLRIWAHGDHPGARVLAERTGFTRARVLWQMRRPLTTPLPDVPMPAGVALRAFRPGADDDAWLAVNGRAFAHHPEQGRWTTDDLRVRMAEPWFDPAGFLLAVDAHDRLLGFHWTKVHPAEPRTDGTTQGPIGEIYVLGVDPGGHRRGLGAALSVAGLRHLSDRGLTDAMLYVDESNAGAVALYTRLGFSVYATDVSYHHHG